MYLFIKLGESWAIWKNTLANCPSSERKTTSSCINSSSFRWSPSLNWKCGKLNCSSSTGKLVLRKCISSSSEWAIIFFRSPRTLPSNSRCFESNFILNVFRLRLVPFLDCSNGRLRAIISWDSKHRNRRSWVIEWRASKSQSSSKNVSEDNACWKSHCEYIARTNCLSVMSIFHLPSLVISYLENYHLFNKDAL